MTLTPQLTADPDLVTRYANLASQPHASLISHASSGAQVPTVVRIAPYAGRFVAQMPITSGKIERIAHNPEVLLAPCENNGRLLSDPIPAVARLMAPEELVVVQVALTAKYGWWFRALAVAYSAGRLLRFDRARHVGVELTLR